MDQDDIESFMLRAEFENVDIQECLNKCEQQRKDKREEVGHHTKRSKFRQFAWDSQHKWYTGAVTMALTSLSLMAIPLVMFYQNRLVDEKHYKQYHSTNLVGIYILFSTSFVYLFELIWKFYAFGFTQFFKTQAFWIKMEIPFQIGTFCTLYLFVYNVRNYDPEVSKSDYNSRVVSIILSVLSLFRTLRKCELLTELELWNNMANSMKALSSSFMALFASLYFLYMIYAVLGMRLYGGMINKHTMVELVKDY